MTTAHGEVLGYQGTHDVLASLNKSADTMFVRIVVIADQLTTSNLDVATLTDAAAVIDAAQTVCAATATALNGLIVRHGAIAEAITTSPLAEATAEARRTGDPAVSQPASDIPPSPAARVSFADLDRDARLKAMHEEINDAVTRMADLAGWKAFLDAATSFHRYSFTNAMLLAMQRPEAQLPFAGFKSWRKNHDRTVRKGEKACWIYAPTTRTVTDTDPDTGEERKTRRVVGFHPVPVYSLDQTDGKALPPRPTAQVVRLDGEAPDGLLEHLARQATERGFTVEYRDNIGEADGYTDFAAKRVVIDSTASGQQRALTLAHELAHIALGHENQTGSYHTGSRGRRSEMEIEAESVAYILARHHGLTEPGQASFGYITDWTRGDTDKIRATADHVLAAAHELLSDREAN